MKKDLGNYQKKKLFYLCAKRGMKETEILLQSFAEQWIERLTPKELKDFEQLLQCPDGDLLEWLMRKTPVPDPYNTTVFQKLLIVGEDLRKREKE